MQHPSAPPRVWGAAYHIPPSKVDEVRSYLDIREINGYTMDLMPFYASVVPSPHAEADERRNSGNDTTSLDRKDVRAQQGSIKCLLYVGLPTNPQFVGPQDPDALAEHIYKSRGPSGENRDYLYLLEKALLALGEDGEDEHVSDLARRVRTIERRQRENDGEE